MPDRRRAVLLVYLKTGSRYESQSQNGLSHFVEHMLFRGTGEHASAHALATAFEELGGTLDATTAADHGTLGISVPEENLSQVIPLVAEVYQNPLFSDLELERGIIREEVLEDLSEEGHLIDPAGLLRSLAFGNSGLGRAITGPLENVDRFTEAELREHHQRTYIANHAVISVAGPVEVETITRQLESSFSALHRRTPLEAVAPPPQNEPRFLHVHHPGSSQTSLSLGHRCPGQTHALEPAVDMLLRIIDDGMATRLYHRLCDSQGLCYSVSGSYEAYDETGLVELEADATHERAPLVLEEMIHLTDELAESLVTSAEFERTQKRTRWQHEALTDEAIDTADFVALAELTRTAATPAERLQQLLAVTREDIRTAADQIFRKHGRSTVSVGSPSSAQIRELRELADS